MSNPFAQGPQGPQGPGGQPPYGGQPQQPYGQQPPGQPYPQQGGSPYPPQQPFGQGAPGPYPQQPGGWGGMPPMAPPPRRRKKWPFIVGGVVVVAVVGAIAVGALSKEDAEKAKVGDCMEHVKKGGKDDVKLADCGSPKGEYKVVAKFEKTEDTSKCDDVPEWEKEYSFTLKDKGGSDDLVVCLNAVPGVEDTD